MPQLILGFIPCAPEISLSACCAAYDVTKYGFDYFFLYATKAAPPIPRRTRMIMIATTAPPLPPLLASGSSLVAPSSSLSSFSRSSLLLS